MPSLLGMAPTRKAASMSVKALFTSSVARTPATRGRAESCHRSSRVMCVPCLLIVTT